MNPATKLRFSVTAVSLIVIVRGITVAARWSDAEPQQSRRERRRETRDNANSADTRPSGDFLASSRRIEPATQFFSSGASSRPSAVAMLADYRDRFTVLAEHNVFVKDRASLSRRPTTGRTTAPLTPEQQFVLTGIVLEEGQRRAYVEDRSAGAIKKLSVGDTLARGKVREIDIDAICYDRAGAATWVSIGSDLTGTTPVPVVSPDAGAIDPSLAGLDPNSPNLTPEQKMKLRRMSELKK